MDTRSTIKISELNKKKLVALQKKHSFSTLTKYIYCIIEFLEKSNIDPSSSNVELLSNVQDMQKEIATMKKWIGALKRDFWFPLLINSDYIKRDIKELISLSQTQTESVKEKDPVKKEKSKEIENLEREIRILRKKNLDLTTNASIFKSVMKTEISKLDALIQSDKGLFGTKLYIDKDKLEEQKKAMLKLFDKI